MAKNSLDSSGFLLPGDVLFHNSYSVSTWSLSLNVNLWQLLVGGLEPKYILTHWKNSKLP